MGMEQWRGAALQSREELGRLAEEMVSSGAKNLSDKKAWLNAGESGARYSHKTAWMEGFLRPLFGLAPLGAGGFRTDLWEIYLEGIKNGTDPGCSEYWGRLEGKDQKIVEMASRGLALAMVPVRIWEPLYPREKARLEQWLLQINSAPLAANNWLFFPVIVNIGLKRVGASYSKEIIAQALEKIEDCYLSDGWYSDGPGLQRDYYISFAMHFYGLLYSVFMGEEDPKRAVVYRERAEWFAKDFIYWFASDGTALPFGRSLTYRFAMVAFWSAAAFAGVEIGSWGIMKGIILRNIRWWMKQPVFNRDGLLTIGYRYPNLKMAEFYNAPGSPAWAMKAFLVLALPETHPFWTAREESLPVLSHVSVQPHPFMVITRTENGAHIQALTSGQYARFEPSFMAAKYEKFAYSNVFGFSVPGGEYGLEQGAFDSMLALCEEDDELYRVRRRCEAVRIGCEGIWSRWKPWSDVEIQTWLIPCGPWHVRVHRIRSERRLKGGEGAYAVNCDTYEGEEGREAIKEERGLARAFYPWGCTGIADLEGSREGRCILAHPNTNLLYSRTRIPTLTGAIEPGTTWLACAVLGMKQTILAKEEWDRKPVYARKGNCFAVTYMGEKRWYEMEK